MALRLIQSKLSPKIQPVFNLNHKLEFRILINDTIIKSNKPKKIIFFSNQEIRYKGV